MRTIVTLAALILATVAVADVKPMPQPPDCCPRWQRPITEPFHPRLRIRQPGYLSIVIVPLERDHEMTSYRSPLSCDEVRALLEPWQLEQFKCVDLQAQRRAGE